MKKCFFLISFFIAFVANMNLKAETSSDEVFVMVEQMPEFPGGEQELWNFLSSNMRYPVIAMENNIQGEVVVQFIVEKDGSITDVQVVKSVDPSLDKEAVRMVRIMPKWQAGMQQGKPVRVKYLVPIKFTLGSKIKFR